MTSTTDTIYTRGSCSRRAADPAGQAVQAGPAAPPDLSDPCEHPGALAVGEMRAIARRIAEGSVPLFVGEDWIRQRLYQSARVLSMDQASRAARDCAMIARGWPPERRPPLVALVDERRAAVWAATNALLAARRRQDKIAGLGRAGRASAVAEARVEQCRLSHAAAGMRLWSALSRETAAGHLWQRQSMPDHAGSAPGVYAPRYSVRPSVPPGAPVPRAS